MCLGAIYWVRPSKIYYANTRQDAANIGFDDSFIYDELTVEMTDRKISMIAIGRESALASFVLWQQKEDKIAY
jgi:tRNA(Arg) A34 adenosine deaminase TadA